MQGKIAGYAAAGARGAGKQTNNINPLVARGDTKENPAKTAAIQQRLAAITKGKAAGGK